MSEYRIDKTRTAALLTLAGPRTVAGDLFVQPYTSRRSGPELPQDILNNSDAFFPFALESGETVMISKDHLVEAHVETNGLADELAAAGMPAAKVELSLSGGVSRVGTLYLEAPRERPRLLDVLNHLDHRFFPLIVENGVRFINRRYLEYVRPLD